jgi:hypothetical protein
MLRKADENAALLQNPNCGARAEPVPDDKWSIVAVIARYRQVLDVRPVSKETTSQVSAMDAAPPRSMDEL